MDIDWELSQSLESDGQGIRAACVLLDASSTSDTPDSFRILTGTQGGSLVEYGVPSGSLSVVDYQHNHAVTALLSFKTDNDDKQYYATGCKDSVIRIFHASSHTLETSLQGHEKAVTSLAFMEPHYLISGSWDGTAKVWNLSNHSLVTTLEGHENTVSVCVLDTNKICTGSAGIAQNNTISDHSIRIWQINPTTGESSLLKKVSNDHDGPIRDVCFSNQTLASCSNDGTVKLRNVSTGEASSTLVIMTENQKHPPMLLSVCVKESWIAASAEDGHVVLWQRDTGNQKLLRHASCVWKVLALPNGDVATCSQDGILRIFTMATNRMASVEERQKFVEAAQAALEKQSSGPSPEEVAKLPKWEMNSLQTGRSEGQVQLFNKGGVAIAAQWSQVSKTWIEVGQVMGSAGDQGMIDGVKYDFVLPIEVDTADGGVAKLQIGYNNGENPFVAAQRFLDHHVLPQHHLADIADYIRQRVGHAAPTLGAADASGAATATPALLLQHLPFKGYKSFDLVEKTATTTMEKMTKKILENNAEQSQKIDETNLSSLVEKLVATSRYHSCQVTQQELSVITTMLQHWPPAQAFAALDLARLTVLIPDAASTNNTPYWKQVLQLSLRQCQTVSSNDKTAAVAVPMLSLRLFANCFRGGSGSLTAVTEQLDSILTCTESFVKSKNKNIRLSVATVLLNVASYLHSFPNAAYAPRVVTMVASALECRTYESEATTRLLVALGTVLLNNNTAQDTAKQLYLTTKVEPAASPHGAKAKAVAKEIYTILS